MERPPPSSISEALAAENPGWFAFGRQHVFLLFLPSVRGQAPIRRKCRVTLVTS